MRIGFFTDDYFPRKDGVGYTIKTWKQKLESRGHEVKVVYPGSSYEPGEGEIPVRSLSNPFYHGHHIGLPLATSKFPEVDVVHCHSPGPVGIMASYYAWRKNIPSVYTYHTPIEDYIPHFLGSEALSQPLKKMYVGLDNRFMNSFDVVTSNTEDIERDVDPEILPVGVDTDFFHPRDPDFLDDMDIERPVVGYSGRISEEKNIEDVLEMAHKFSGSVFIVGEGRHREDLEEMAPGNVYFMDFLPREELPRFLSSLDVFVTASQSDTLCLSALEANACGTPIVAPDLPPFTRTVDERNGLRYKAGDPEDFCARVEECLESSLDPCSKAEEFSVEKTVEKIEEIYRSRI